MAPPFTLSKYVQSLQLDDDTFAIANGLTLQRMIVSGSVNSALMLFAGQSLTIEDFVDGVELPDVATPRETLTAMFRSFQEKGFVVPAENFDEDARVRKLVGDRVRSIVPFEQYQMPHRMTLDAFEIPAALAKSSKHLEVLFLGGCLVQFVEEPLRAIAASYGLTIGVRTGWLTDTHLLESDPKPDLVVLQPGTFRLLSSLWGGAAWFESDAERRRILELAKEDFSRCILALEDFTGYVLVQGLSTLQMPPHGRSDDRLPTGHHRVVFELNDLVRRMIAERSNMMFVDEERLAGNHGKAALFDDMITDSRHHGTLDSTLPRLLAKEYLDSYLILSGLRRIKCIVTDLDNTLWAGVVGEGDPPTPHQHPFPAIHDTLATLKQRGILLATCSKNNHDDMMRFWAGLDKEVGVLSPDDFVWHSINWDSKSSNLAAIIEKLGVAPEAILFIDDNPVERAEVQARFPQIRVLGEDLRGLRRTLLTDPCLQPNVITDEARGRTITTKAHLSREAARESVSDPKAFLQSLEVRVNVSKIETKLHFERLVELSQRTNQFNTTLVRYDVRTLEDLLRADDASVWAMSAKDRFAQYGLVGICVVRGDQIENVCISCRTIGIAVEQPFLATVLHQSGLYAKRAIGRIVIGDRNHPSRQLFATAGFADLGDGLYAREPTAVPPSVEASISTVVICPEIVLTRFE
jgi:FkbH-like protein